MTNGEAVNWIINISADIGKAEHRDLWHYEQALSEIREMLESAQPERKRGKWIPQFGGAFKGGAYWYRCSECGHGVTGGLPCQKWFCENCGADMREE